MSPTAWTWLLLIVEVGLIDGILSLLNQPTLSQFLWRSYKRHWWARWAVLSLIVVVALHLVAELWGAPSKTPAPPDCPDCT